MRGHAAHASATHRWMVADDSSQVPASCARGCISRSLTGSLSKSHAACSTRGSRGSSPARHARLSLGQRPNVFRDRSRVMRRLAARVSLLATAERKAARVSRATNDGIVGWRDIGPVICKLELRYKRRMDSWSTVPRPDRGTHARVAIGNTARDTRVINRAPSACWRTRNVGKTPANAGTHADHRSGKARGVTARTMRGS
mmetsp:Transcript_36216/g.78392  ORF Transcript_36216/g.78392 Transcript_36216/m.78392 type:complete len:200 (+) Transcript_36216:414-1013(+)